VWPKSCIRVIRLTERRLKILKRMFVSFEERLLGGAVIRRSPMPRTHPPYAPEYRRRLVELVRAGRSIAELARAFGVSANAIRKWVKQTALDEGRRSDGLTTTEREELTRLRRENRVLREEQPYQSQL
jgi:transposase